MASTVFAVSDKVKVYDYHTRSELIVCELRCAIDKSYNDVFDVFLHLVLIQPMIWSACHKSIIGKLIVGKASCCFTLIDQL